MPIVDRPIAADSYIVGEGCAAQTFSLTTAAMIVASALSVTLRDRIGGDTSAAGAPDLSVTTSTATTPLSAVRHALTAFGAAPACIDAASAHLDRFSREFGDRVRGTWAAHVVELVEPNVVQLVVALPVDRFDPLDLHRRWALMDALRDALGDQIANDLIVDLAYAA